MKSLSSHISLGGWTLSLVSCIPATIIILAPPFGGLATAFTLKLATFIALEPLCTRIFARLFPDTREFYLGFSLETFAASTFLERVKTIESMMRFPRKYALFQYLSAFIKSVPCFCAATLLWPHSTRSNFSQFLHLLAISAAAFTYLYGIAFLAAHQTVTKFIAQAHAHSDLAEAFAQVKIPYSRKELFVKEGLVLLFLALTTLALQGISVKQANGTPPVQLALQLLLIGGAGTSLMAHLWFLHRKQFLGGLTPIFKHIPLLSYQNSATTLPLHSSPLLARFDQAFNLLTHRLRASEKELSTLVMFETERTRYRALGEMSALIAHDLSGPLHVAQFCVQELQEKPNLPNRDRYLEQLSINIGRAVELITSIRARLKNPEANPAECQFQEAHLHVIRLLETQFSPKIFAEVQIEIDSDLENLALSIPRVDLIHILDNLYRNSIQNLLNHQIALPKISIRLGGKNATEAMIVLMDNGTGLSTKHFEELTNHQAPGKPAQQSLGLRLTRRLVELNNGSLSLIEPMSQQGTTFCLKLKTARVRTAIPIQDEVAILEK